MSSGTWQGSLLSIYIYIERGPPSITQGTRLSCEGIIIVAGWDCWSSNIPLEDRETGGRIDILVDQALSLKKKKKKEEEKKEEKKEEEGKEEEEEEKKKTKKKTKK